MLAEVHMREIVKSLVNESKKNRVQWLPEKGTATPWQDTFHASLFQDPTNGPALESVGYVVNFPRSKVEFARLTNGKETEVFHFRFLSSDESLLGSWTIGQESRDWALAKELFSAVSSQVVSDWQTFLDDIRSAADSRGVETELVPDPNGAEFYKWVAGDWHLTWYRGDQVIGEQDLSIDHHGNLFIPEKGPGREFILKNIDFRPKEKTVSFWKVRPNGNGVGHVFQTELLKIADDEARMYGQAKHDAHRLIYEEKQINVSDLKALLPSAPHFTKPAKEEDYDNALIYFLSHGINGKRRLTKFLGDKRVFDKLSEIYKEVLLRKDGVLDPMAIAAYGVPLFIGNLNEEVVKSVIHQVKKSREYRENREKIGVR